MQNNSRNIFLEFDSSTLPGAISLNNDFFCLEQIKGKKKRNDINGYTDIPIVHFVSNKFIKDEEHDFFIGEYGVVAGCFDFRKLSKYSLNKFLADELLAAKNRYPDYDFKIEGGRFPLDVGRVIYDEEKRKYKGEVKMSSHILYITNYEEVLNKFKNNKVKVLK